MSGWCRRLVVLFWVAPAFGQTARQGAPEVRWLPEDCVQELSRRDGRSGGEGESAEERWNNAYRRGFAAIEGRDVEAAESNLCQALAAARDFPSGDLRFAETLDELGLVAFLREDYRTAEALQGAAVTEILLALGPPAPDLSPEQQDSCRSSVRTYLTRLGWVFERQGRPDRIQELQDAPYRVLGMGYVPGDNLAPRLEWLIARYLLLEDVTAADWLLALRDRLRLESASP